MGFTMIIPRRPISVGSGGREKFQLALQAAALPLVAKAPLFDEGPLYARLIWFHSYRTAQDVDNIAKRVFDALAGVVYTDDSQLDKVVLEKLEYPSEQFSFADRTMPAGAFGALIQMLGDRLEDIIYVEVDVLQSRRIVFGPIDRGS